MIKINPKLKIILFVNLLLVSLISIELWLPSNDLTKERFERTFITVKRIQNYRKTQSEKEITNFLKCLSGNIYKIGSVPKELENLKAGQDIEIVKTMLFSKVKVIMVDSHEITVLFLAHKYILIGICLATLVFILAIFYSNIWLDYIFLIASVFIWFITITYLLF